MGAKKIAFLLFYISAFCSLTDRPTDKISTENMLICKTNLHKKNWTSIIISDGENRVSPKPDIHTDRRMDISIYRVASLLKNGLFSEITKFTEKNYLKTEITAKWSIKQTKN